MHSLKWMRMVFAAGVLFFATPQNLLANTSSPVDIPQSLSISSISPSSFLNTFIIVTDTYLGGSFQVGWFSDTWNAIKNIIDDIWNSATDTNNKKKNKVSGADGVGAGGSGPGNGVESETISADTTIGAPQNENDMHRPLERAGSAITPSEQNTFLADPYGYFLAQEKQATVDNARAENNGAGTVNPANYATQQTIQQLQALSPVERAGAMSNFYSSAVNKGDADTLSVISGVINSDGTITNGGGSGQSTNNTPVAPTNPETPTAPTNPETPTIPTNPETPTTPTNPETPTTPTNPETPTTPTTPETPATPTNPVTPTAPTNPVTPVTPTNPPAPTPSKAVVDALDFTQANIATANAMINSSGMAATSASAMKTQFAANPSDNSLASLAASIQFAKLYTAANQTGATASAIAAYHSYVDSLPAATIVNLMQSTVDNKLISNDTVNSTLNAQLAFLSDPYKYLLQIETNAQQNIVNFRSGVFMPGKSGESPLHAAMVQIRALLSAMNLTPAQKADLMGNFYTSAIFYNSFGITFHNGSNLINDFKAIMGNDPLPYFGISQYYEYASADLKSYKALLAVVDNNSAVTAGYNSDYYFNALNVTSNLNSVEKNITTVTGTTSASLTTMIAQSGASAANQSLLNQWVKTNSNNPTGLNALAATLQYTKLFNAAYPNGNAAALAAFSNYSKSFSSTTELTMMNFAVANGLVSQQNGLIVSNPYQYFINQEKSVPAGADAAVYAMAQMYNATRYWSADQLKVLASRLYYTAVAAGSDPNTSSYTGGPVNGGPGDTIRGNAISSMVLDYFSPNGAYYNNVLNLPGVIDNPNAPNIIDRSDILAPLNISAMTALITNANLNATATNQLKKWIADNNTSASTALLARAVTFTKLYNANFDASATSADKTAYNSFISKIPPNALAAIAAYSTQQKMTNFIQDLPSAAQTIYSKTLQSTPALTGLLTTDPAVYAQDVIDLATQSNSRMSVAMFPKFFNAERLASLSYLPVPYKVDPTQYAIAMIYQNTKAWSQAQLTVLAKQLFSDPTLKSTGFSSALATYLSPQGVYQNNPQNILTAQLQKALTLSSSSPQMSVESLTKALQSLSPTEAQAWIDTFNRASSGGIPDIVAGYRVGIAKYQESLTTVSSTQATQTTQPVKSMESDPALQQTPAVANQAIGGL